MPSGVRDMGSNTATNLSPLNGMPNYPYPLNPKVGSVIYNYYKRVCMVWNGNEWVDVILNEHRCKLDNEKSVQE